MNMINKRNWDQSASTISSKLYIAVIILFSAINIIFIGFSIALWIGSAKEKLFTGTDFYSIFRVFATMRSNMVGETFKIDFWSLLKNGILGGLVIDGAYPLQYPPSVAIMFLPLSFLPFDIAFYIWTIIQLGLLIWLFVLLNRHFSNWSQPERFVLAITLLAFWPVSITIILGQFSLLLLLCIVQVYIALNDSQKVGAGFWLALMMIKPQTILIPAVITLNKKYFRTAASFFLTVLTIVFIITMIYGLISWQKYSQFLLLVGNRFENSGFVSGSEYTFRGLLTGIFGNSQSQFVNSITIIFLFLGMLLTWLLWLRNIPPGTPSFALRFAFISALSVFLSLHLYPHDSLLLVLPAALFYDFLRQNNYPRKIYSILIIICPSIFFFAAFNRYNLFGIVRPPMIAIIALLIYMGYYLVLDIRKGLNNTSSLSMEHV